MKNIYNRPAQSFRESGRADFPNGVSRCHRNVELSALNLNLTKLFRPKWTAAPCDCREQVVYVWLNATYVMTSASRIVTVVHVGRISATEFNILDFLVNFVNLL